jgi:hypothetical protein
MAMTIDWYKLAPEIESDLRERLNVLLERRFAHMDFWILNKKWKGIHIDQVTSEIIFEIEAEITRYITEGKNNA